MHKSPIQTINKLNLIIESEMPIQQAKKKPTTPGTSCPTLCDKCVGSLTSPADHNSEDMHWLAKEEVKLACHILIKLGK